MAKTRKERKPKTTIQKYRFWRNWDIGLTSAKYAMPLIPFATVLGINWEEWVTNASEGWSIGIGFGMLAIATIAGIIGIWKKDKIANEKISPVYYAAIVLAVIGFSFKLLSAMIDEMGNMFLYVSLGVIASGTIDQVDKSAISPKKQHYLKLVNDNGLSKASAKLIDDEEQAKKEGEEAKRKRQNRAVE